MKRERRKKKERGRRGPLSSSSTIGTVERIAETRKTSRTKNALLPGSLESFSKRGAKLAPFSDVFREEKRRTEPWIEVRVPFPFPCPFFLSLGI